MGTHIALEDQECVVLGIITRPVLGMRWWASRGGGAYEARASYERAHRPLEPQQGDVGRWPPEAGNADSAPLSDDDRQTRAGGTFQL